MNEVDLADELWSPFPSAASQFFYLTLDDSTLKTKETLVQVPEGEVPPPPAIEF